MSRRDARRVTDWELRKIFNDGDYYAKVLRNELVAVVERDGLASPAMNQPPGTRSQTVRYYDRESGPVAFVHQFVMPDGSLGASGKPDPKRIWFENEILYC